MPKSLHHTWIRAIAGAACLTAALPLMAQDDVVRGATAVTSYVGSRSGSTANSLINQSGLSATYTSGSTAFDAFVSTALGTASNAPADAWASAAGRSPGYLVFDLGAVYTLNGAALWTMTDIYALKSFELYADTDSDPNNGGTTLLGSYTLQRFAGASTNANVVPAQSFSFAEQATQYVAFKLPPTNLPRQGFTEIAFSEVLTPVPEPGTAALMLAGVAAVVATRRRRTG